MSICLRLYSEEDFSNRPAFADPKDPAHRKAWPPSVLPDAGAFGLGEMWGGFPRVRSVAAEVACAYRDGPDPS